MLLENIGVEIPNDQRVTVYFAPMGEKEGEKAFELATALRNKGVICDFDHMGRGIKAQFKYADKIGAKFVAVIGSNELASGVVKLKNMVDGSEKEVSFAELLTLDLQ